MPSRLLEQLTTTTDPAERRRISGDVIADMQAGVNYGANLAYYGLCEAILGPPKPSHRRRGAEPRGEFSALGSAALIKHVPRVSGFLRGIARTAETRTQDATMILDAGTGPGALLAIAAAQHHPMAEVVAYEINTDAAECARTVVDLMGYKDRVRIITGNVMHEDLPYAKLALTETFGPGIRGSEMGVAIAEHLAQSAEELLPRYVRIHASNSASAYQRVWPEAAYVDLAEHNETVSGRFKDTTPGGAQEVQVYATFYDAQNGPIVVQPGNDSLTTPVSIGWVTVPKAGVPINFIYGINPEHPVDTEIWAA